MSKHGSQPLMGLLEISLKFSVTHLYSLGKNVSSCQNVVECKSKNCGPLFCCLTPILPYSLEWNLTFKQFRISWAIGLSRCIRKIKQWNLRKPPKVYIINRLYTMYNNIDKIFGNFSGDTVIIYFLFFGIFNHSAKYFDERSKSSWWTYFTSQ